MFVAVAAGRMLVLFLILNASLPPLDGEIPAAQISADIRIQGNADGIATMIADNRSFD